MPRYVKAEGAFWARVNKDGPIPDVAPGLGPCWIYGSGKRNGPAARRAYSLHHGAPPAGAHICHHCGNGHIGCVRPSHLYAGDACTNHEDKVRMGRLAHGFTHGKTIYDPLQVKLMRTLAVHGNAPVRWLQDLFGGHKDTVIKFVRGGVPGFKNRRYCQPRRLVCWLPKQSGVL